MSGKTPAPHFVSICWSEPDKLKMEVGDVCLHELRNRHTSMDQSGILGLFCLVYAVNCSEVCWWRCALSHQTQRSDALASTRRHYLPLLPSAPLTQTEKQFAEDPPWRCQSASQCSISLQPPTVCNTIRIHYRIIESTPTWITRQKLTTFMDGAKNSA